MMVVLRHYTVVLLLVYALYRERAVESCRCCVYTTAAAGTVYTLHVVHRERVRLCTSSVAVHHIRHHTHNSSKKVLGVVGTAETAGPHTIIIMYYTQYNVHSMCTISKTVVKYRKLILF